MDVIRKRGIDSLDDFAFCTRNIILITNYDDKCFYPMCIYRLEFIK